MASILATNFIQDAFSPLISVFKANMVFLHTNVTDARIQKPSCQSVAPGSAKFLFIPDVTASATGGVLILLIVLYIGSQLISSLMTTATVDRNQRLIALGLPFVFTIFILSFPAG